MKLAIYWGCMISTSQYAYEVTLRKILEKLELDYVEVEPQSCCGSPVSSISHLASTYLSARNLAIAQKNADTLLVPCNGCYLNLTLTLNELNENKELANKIEELLSQEGLEKPKKIKILHPINLFHDYIGLEKIAEKVEKPLKNLKFATHTGCHLIRPSTISGIDNPEKPVKLDRIIEALGGTTIDYPEKLECCGAGLLLSHPETALAMSGKKLKILSQMQIDALINSCPSCHLMFDGRQEAIASTLGIKIEVPVLYLTQLMGLAYGINQEELALNLNQSPVDKLLNKL